MNIRFTLFVWLVLGAPLWLGLLRGDLDPDEAGLRLVIAGVLALGVEWVARTFVNAARPTPAPRPARPDDDTSSKTQ